MCIQNVRRWVLLVLVVIAVPTARADFNFRDFRTTAGINLLESAHQSGVRLRLTDGSQMDKGAAWFANKQALANGFSADFHFQLGDRSVGGSDGLVFVIQNSDTAQIGSHGGSLGYGGLQNIVAVEFDTYRNTGAAFRDPQIDHLSVMTGVNHTTSQIGNSLTGLNLGTSLHAVRIDYVPGTMEVYLDDLNSPVLSVGIDLASINEGNTLDEQGGAFVGFTAATGDGTQTHDVLRWSLATPRADLDSDQDGFTNLEEAIAGTDSLNASDFLLLALNRRGNQLDFTWNAKKFRNYKLECSPDLTVGSWTEVDSVAAAPVERLVTRTRPLSQAPQYYRLTAAVIPSQ